MRFRRNNCIRNFDRGFKIMCIEEQTVLEIMPEVEDSTQPELQFDEWSYLRAVADIPRMEKE